jgi:hypothetical protein
MNKFKLALDRYDYNARHIFKRGIIPYNYMIETVNFIIHKIHFGSIHKLENPTDHITFLYKDGIEYPCFQFEASENRNKFCLVPFFTDLYSMSELYKEKLGDIGYKDLDLFSGYPLVKRSDIKSTTFKDYLKNEIHSHRTPYFFGKKSEEVEWQVIENQERYDIIRDTMGYMADHDSYIYHTYYPDGNVIDLIECLTFDWRNTKDYYMFCAYDKLSKQYVACMKVLVVDNVAECILISASNEEEHYKYSLVPNAHLACIKYFFFDKPELGVDIINLGLNYIPCGNYKDEWARHTEKFKGFDTFNSFEEINQFCIKDSYM